ncbi:Ger(x)C family spore germination protein [Cytobacillus firmus]|uniref:Ger(x)C family spore germination protein n=2 Tax=Bacillales TaxID=1385 RepID=UPI001CFE11B7|nr:Ger(x)C family spore germination protein [Cytobacillus firmus]
MLLTLRKGLLMAVAFLILVSQTGCTDIKEMKDLNYATAIGVDYKDGKYHTYIQMVDLMKVAKTEGGDTSPAKMWVSEAEGETFNSAFFEVYNTAQARTIWAHVTAIVLSESALEQGFHEILDGLTRYHEFRLTPWVYGTKEPIKDILSTLGFFGQTTLDTILHAPESVFQQSSKLRPIQFFKLAKQIYEPAFTAYVPSLSINASQWEENKKKEPKLALNGAFFIKNKNFKGFYPYDVLKGIRWVIPKMERIQVLVPNEDDPEFLPVFDDPKAMYRARDGRIDIEVEAKGYITNRDNNKTTNLKQMEELTEAAIKNEIQKLFDLGIKENTDFLNLEHTLYRDNWQEWKKNKHLTQDSLKSIIVDVEIIHSGGSKNRLIDMDYLK